MIFIKNTKYNTSYNESEMSIFKNNFVVFSFINAFYNNIFSDYHLDNNNRQAVNDDLSTWE